MLNQKISDIIRELKKVREENGLSYQKIVDMVAQNGDYVSMSTVKKVFEEGSENFGYQYDNTIRPIASALLGIYSNTKSEASAAEADAMKAIIDYKSEKIYSLQQQLDKMEERYDKRVEFLKNQIERKDTIIDKRDDMITKLIDVIIEMKRG